MSSLGPDLVTNPRRHASGLSAVLRSEYWCRRQAEAEDQHRHADEGEDADHGEAQAAGDEGCARDDHDEAEEDHASKDK
jgi:hypothetical protein